MPDFQYDAYIFLSPSSRFRILAQKLFVLTEHKNRRPCGASRPPRPLGEFERWMQFHNFFLKNTYVRDNSSQH